MSTFCFSATFRNTSAYSWFCPWRWRLVCPLHHVKVSDLTAGLISATGRYTLRDKVGARHQIHFNTNRINNGGVLFAQTTAKRKFYRLSVLLAGTPAGTCVVTCVYLQLDQHICPSLHQHDYLWSCNQSTDETRARIAGVHGVEHRWGWGWGGRQRGRERRGETWGERKREREKGAGGKGDIQGLLPPLTQAVQWEIIFGYLWYHQSDRNHVWSLSEVESLVHTIKHQQVLTLFFWLLCFVLLVIFFLVSFPF